MKRNAEKADLEVPELTKEEARYIVIGTEDGWLEYNKRDYEKAKEVIK